MEYDPMLEGSVDSRAGLSADPHWSVRVMVWEPIQPKRWLTLCWAIGYLAVGFAQLFRESPEPLIGSFFMAASIPAFMYWKGGVIKWGLLAYSALCIVSFSRAASRVAFLLTETWHGALIVLSAWTLLRTIARSHVAHLLLSFWACSVRRSSQ